MKGGERQMDDKHKNPTPQANADDIDNNISEFGAGLDTDGAYEDDYLEGSKGGQISSDTVIEESAEQDTLVSATTSSDGKGKQGFKSMNPDRQKEIASLGGKAAHAQGKAHEWDSEEAKHAGKIGGSR